MNEVILKGCSPTPLASYLKALAILRLVSEQKDGQAKGSWRGEHFVLHSTLGKDALQQFFLEQYRPTPIISPWNGRAGFLEGEDVDQSTRGGAVAVNAFSQEHIHERFLPIKKVIETIQSISTLQKLNEVRSQKKRLENEVEEKKKAGNNVPNAEKEELGKLKKAEKPLKNNVCFALRNEAQDDWLQWFDACQILAESVDGDPKCTPLLGSGGNDGSTDFGMNYMQCLNNLFDINNGKATDLACKLIGHALFDTPTCSIEKIKPGQFNPGGSISPNSGTGYKGIEHDNRWNYILTLEGALLFAASATKKLERPDQFALSFPFSVDVVSAGDGLLGIGDGKTPDGKKLTELWLPLWSNKVDLMELKALFSEGKATLGRKRVKDGLDFSRAVSQIAINRGIDAFERYAFLMRSGKAYLATPIGRFSVPRQATTDLILDLEKYRWLGRFQSYARSNETPARLKMLAHQLDNALFELSRKHSERTVQVQAVLGILGNIQLYAAKSPAYRFDDKKKQTKVPPAPVLSGSWVKEANDNSGEFRIAAALAGLYMPADDNAQARQHHKEHPMPFRTHIAPESEKNPQWLEDDKGRDARSLCVWTQGELNDNLAAVLKQRLLRRQQCGLPDKPLCGPYGCDLHTITGFLNGALDERKIKALVCGLSLCRIPGNQVLGWGEDHDQVLVAAYGLLKLLFSANVQLRRSKVIGETDSLPASLRILRLLEAGRIPQALSESRRRLQIIGFSNVPVITTTAIDHKRLAAALLIPLTDSALRQIKKALCLTDNFQEPATQSKENDHDDQP